MYKVKFRKSAEKELKALPRKMQIRIGEAIDDLEENPRPVGCKKLSGSAINAYRIRVGDYRILYIIEEVIKIVEVQKIGHRKDVYRF